MDYRKMEDLGNDLDALIRKYFKDDGFIVVDVNVKPCEPLEDGDRVSMWIKIDSSLTTMEP